jgi:hypothetical protein
MTPRQAACNQYDAFPSVLMPRDQNMTATGTGVEIGNGQPLVSELNAYWQDHYGAAWPTDAGVPLTRYKAYLQETGSTPPALRAGSEPRAPACYATNGGSLGTQARRVLSVSIVDCTYWNVHGNASNNIRTSKQAEFFITEPSPDGSVYTEFIRLVTPETSNGNLHRIIQLYK